LVQVATTWCCEVQARDPVTAAPGGKGRDARRIGFNGAQSRSDGYGALDSLGSSLILLKTYLESLSLFIVLYMNINILPFG